MNLILHNPQENANSVFASLDVSESTRDDYKNRIRLFLTFVHDRGVNHNSFLEFKRFLVDKTDWTISTKNKYLTTAKVFLKELNRQQMLPVDITQNVKNFSQSKKHKRDGLNDEEIALLMDKMSQLSNTPSNARLKAILSLLALQGLRQIEIIRLNVSDIDLISKQAFVHGKGRDDKEPVALLPQTVNALSEYLKTNTVRSGALFQSQSNNSINKRLTTRGVRLIVKKVLNELGIEKSTHGFRHYFTTKLIKTYKGDLLEVMGYTRHRSIETLQVYFDRVKTDADLPRFYRTFNGVGF